jgi:hypothetical protein
MRVRSFVPWILVLAVATGGSGIGSVLAQAINEPGWPPPEGAACKPSKQATDEAKTLFGLGNTAFQTSNYTDAIKYWKDAYKRDCSAHLLLKNLGKAYEADAQYAAAVEVYKLYRARGAPKGEELDLIDAKITNLSKKIPATPDTSTATTSTGTTTTTSTTTDTAPTGTVTTAPTGTSTAPTTESKGPGIAPWIVAGAGGAVAITGVILWVSGNSKLSTAADKFNSLRDPAGKGCADPGRLKGLGDITAECRSLEEDGNSGKSTRTVGMILTGVGVAAAGAGIAWAILGNKNSSSGGDSASLVITPGPGLAGLGLSGSF